MKKLIVICVLLGAAINCSADSEKRLGMIARHLLKPTPVGNGEREMPCPIRDNPSPQPIRGDFGIVKPANKVETGKSLMVDAYEER